MTQQDAATQEMRRWLAHPNELGKAPAKIECTGQFEYLGLRYYSFRFKKSLLGSWLAGVCGGYEDARTSENCGHTFSRFERHDPATERQAAIEMIEMIRQYWMQLAQELQGGRQ